MGICNGKPSSPHKEDVEKAEVEREKETKQEALVEEKSGSKPWASPFFPFYTPSPSSSLFWKKSPANGRVSGGATPGRFFKPFLPPSPAKHIRALLARRQGLVKSSEAGGADGEDCRGSAVALDKNFGFLKGFDGKYELGEEVGRGHFGYTCCARSRKGELKGEIVAVKIIPKAKVQNYSFLLRCRLWGSSARWLRLDSVARVPFGSAPYEIMASFFGIKP